MLTLSLITAVLPDMSEHIAETAQSVKEVRKAVAEVKWAAEWIVVIDGPGRHPEITGADKMLTLPKQCGVSAARNYALANATGDWIAPLDGDDLVDVAGLCAILHGIRSPEPAGWIGANRLLIDGGRTPHWKAGATNWEAGSLAKRWTVPFVFHPNSLLVQRELALQVQGWPAVPCNEDLAFLLALSEESAGRFNPHVFARYRLWDKQTIAHPAYGGIKQCAFAVIEQTLNAKREALGRPPIEAPQTAGAVGNFRIGSQKA